MGRDAGRNLPGSGCAGGNTLAEDGDVFDAARQRGVESDLLTEAGREAGWVALRPCPFYGRLMGEIICTFNDALIRAEARMGADIEAGKARKRCGNTAWN